MEILELYQCLTKPGIRKMILDTDTYNEIDDQFALAYAMLSPEAVDLLSVNAAPFLNKKVATAEEGMEQSFAEIHRVMSRVNPASRIPAYRGSRCFLPDAVTPVASEAADNIIRTVMETPEPVYIVAIGAITNVASALLQCPEIVKRSAVIWLGGVGFDAPFFPEFNLRQDVAAAQVVFDSGIPLLQIPTFGVSSSLLTSIPEMRHYLAGKNALADYLLEIMTDYAPDREGWSKVLWDVANIGVFTVPRAYSIVMRPTPILSPDGRYIHDPVRHPYLYVRQIQRDPVFADFLRKFKELN